MPADEIEKFLEPKRLIRIFGRVFLAVVLFFTLVVGVKMAINAMDSVEATSHDHAWFKTQFEEIRALEHQISETRQALEAHKKEVDERWVSRKDDRAQTANLTQKLISQQESLAELVKDYNIAADLASGEALQTLPRSVSIKAKVKSDEQHEN